MFVPLSIEAHTTEELRELKRRLAAALNPRNGDATLIVTHRNGDSRRISGRYAQGFDGALTSGRASGGRTSGSPCDVTSRSGRALRSSRRVSAGSAPTFFDSPFFPLEIGAGQAIGTVVIDNIGDEAAYPVWTIEGPGADVTVSSSSKSWGIDGSIADGETLTIDTRRGVQTVTNEGGVSQWSRVTPNSNLWALEPGDNTVTVAMTSTDSGSSIQVAYTPRYLTAF